MCSQDTNKTSYLVTFNVLQRLAINRPLFRVVQGYQLTLASLLPYCCSHYINVLLFSVAAEFMCEISFET